jgi:D-amino peptidase
MKIFIMTDMEGVAGVGLFDDVVPSGRHYAQSRRLLTQETNAAIEGAFAGGATEVVVADGHGGGGLNVEDLHPDARLLHGGNFPKPTFGLDKTYGALLMVGMHAMSGTADGHLNHTYSHTHIDYIKVNGIEIGEIGIFAMVAGALGVPTVFVSGDAAACREARTLLGNLETAAVKQGLNQDCALALSPRKARELIRTGAEQAVRRRQDFKPFRLAPPYDFVKRYNLSSAGFAVSQYADVEMLDSKTFRIRDTDLLNLLTKII